MRETKTNQIFWLTDNRVMQHKTTKKMKKQLFVMIVFQLLFACSNDDSIDEPTSIVEGNQLNALINEYNINKDGLQIESYTTGIDTTQLFFNGRIDNKLWIGCYDKQTKNKITEWTEKTNLDTILNLNTGYGEYSDFRIVKFFIEYPYYNEEQLYFLLWGYNDETININGRIISSDLYIISNNSLANKKRSFTYPTGDKFYQNITPWINSIFSKYSNQYICYSSEGDSLYSRDENITVDDEPISVEESIYSSAHYDTDTTITFYFKRYNLKNDEIVWKNSVSNNLLSDSRLDSTILEKADSIWDYTFYYTLMDGTKFNRKIGVDINSGDITENK